MINHQVTRPFGNWYFSYGCGNIYFKAVQVLLKSFSLLIKLFEKAIISDEKGIADKNSYGHTSSLQVFIKKE